MASLFISYRRGDSPDTVKLIHERLRERLPRCEIFYDHLSIPLGQEFPELLRKKVAAATAVLVVIGPKWLPLLHERRQEAIDHVRTEVRLALEAGSDVIPVLVGHAAMPTAADLADFADLQPLLRRNGRAVRPDPDFDADLARIICHIKQMGAEESAGTILADKYVLTSEIGRGGMGVVYAAQQKQPIKHTVAVKLIKPGMDSRDVLARFEAERQALAVMDHPNIAKVLDAGIADSGRPFFVMEHVNGVPITQYCDDGKLSPQERLNLFIPVCSAVQHAHQKGIIHRDLKPSNVLVEVVDGKPVPKVIDFGLAKALGQQLTDRTLHTALETRVGTLEYSAPEQAAGRSGDVDTRSDIYSLGVLLYELLTGAPPFTQEELRRIGEEEMRRMIREVEPKSPSKKLSSSGELPAIAAKRRLEPAKLPRMLRGDLDWIVMKCLEKEQARRYDTANQVADELKRFLADEPVQAGPPSMSYRAKKFLRRNKGSVLAATLVFLALIAGIIGTSLGLAQAEAARTAEAEQRRIAQANEATAKEAAEKERQATLTANDRLRQVEKAVGLLESIFADNGPQVDKASSPRHFDELLQRLCAVADKLDGDAIADPLTVARLQHFLGNTLIYLGESRKAAEVLVKAGKVRAKLLGANSDDTLSSEGSLAVAYYEAGKMDQALPLLQQTLEKRKIHNGPDHTDTLACINNLAYAFKQTGRLDLAIPLYVAVLEKRKAALGPDHADTLLGMNNLAVCYQDADRLDLTLPLLEDTYRRCVAKLGVDDPCTLASMNNLALAYQEDNQLAKALPLFEECVARRTAVLGSDHPSTLSAMANLAAACDADAQRTQPSEVQTKQAARVLSLREEVLAKRKTKLGLDHPATLDAMNALAELYRHRMQPAKAAPLHEEALARFKVVLGLDHERTLISMNNLALSYLESGQPAKALPLLEKVLAKRKTTRPDHAETLISLSNMAYAYVEAGQSAKALPLYEELLARKKTKLGVAHHETLDLMNRLAELCRLEGQTSKAIALHEETLAQRKGTLGSDHADTLVSMNNLALAYQQGNQLARAMPLYEEVLAKRQVKLGPDHPYTLLSMNNLAWGCAAVGQASRTVSLHEEVLARRKATLGVDHAETLDSMYRLANSHLEAKQAEKAPPLFEEYLAIRARQWGAEDARYAGQLAECVSNLLRFEHYAAAEPLAHKCLAVRLKTQPDLWSTFNTRAMLGACLLGQKKYAEAEPLLREGYEGMKQREKSIPPIGKPRLTEALKNLVRLHETTNKSAEAGKWRTELGVRSGDNNVLGAAR